MQALAAEYTKLIKAQKKHATGQDGDGKKDPMKEWKSQCRHLLS